jgi:hypothetical protein
MISICRMDWPLSSWPAVLQASANKDEHDEEGIKKE